MRDPKNQPDRRTVLAGAGTAGALAAAAAVLPLGKGTPEAAAPAAAAAGQPTGKGYQLTDHVKHYYATARI